MSNLKVNSKTFNYPNSGTEPNWASDVTGWAEEVTTVLDSTNGLGTITETQSTIENNISSSLPKSVAGLIFNSSLTKSATIEYRIYRKSQNTVEKSEQGILTVNYSQIDPLNKWTLSREINNGEPTLVYLDIDNNGQIKYSSSDILVNTPTVDTNYEGYIRFKTSNIIK